jgi:hypothetical protein
VAGEQNVPAELVQKGGVRRRRFVDPADDGHQLRGPLDVDVVVIVVTAAALFLEEIPMVPLFFKIFFCQFVSNLFLDQKT